MTENRTILVTGGAGFIGASVVRRLLQDPHCRVVTVDCMTYAADVRRLDGVPTDRHVLEPVDIADSTTVQAIFRKHEPDAIVHLAAESHVDRSIDGPGAFIRSNVVGTQVLLDAARDHWAALEGPAREAFRFLHVSTDEVYGSLALDAPPFTETHPYHPNSPYAASKAASDHLVRAWHATYGLPVLVSNCSNNYGPWQFPEKLIPLMIAKARAGETLPVYGRGANVRDWLHVEDHAEALALMLERGIPGRTYNVGGGAERTNLEVVRALCAHMDALCPDGAPHDRLIGFVADRPGHDLRYAIDSSVLRGELGWRPRHDFETGLRDTVVWYLDNMDWWRPILEGTYDGSRLGLRAGGEAS